MKKEIKHYFFLLRKIALYIFYYVNALLNITLPIFFFFCSDYFFVDIDFIMHLLEIIHLWKNCTNTLMLFFVSQLSFVSPFFFVKSSHFFKSNLFIKLRFDINVYFNICNDVSNNNIIKKRCDLCSVLMVQQ